MSQLGGIRLYLFPVLIVSVFLMSMVHAAGLNQNGTVGGSTVKAVGTPKAGGTVKFTVTKDGQDPIEIVAPCLAKERTNIECKKDNALVRCDGDASDKNDSFVKGTCVTKYDNKDVGKPQSCDASKNFACEDKDKADAGLGKPEAACESLRGEGFTTCDGNDEYSVTGCGNTISVGTMVIGGSQNFSQKEFVKNEKNKVKKADTDVEKQKEKTKGGAYSVRAQCVNNKITAHLVRGARDIGPTVECDPAKLRGSAGATIVFMQQDGEHWSGHCDQKELVRSLETKKETPDEWAKNLKKQDGTPHTTDLKDEKGNVVGKLTAQCNGGQKCIENPHDPSCPKSCSATVYDKDGKKINEYTFDPGKIDALKNLAKDGDTLLEKARAESEKKGPPAPTTTPPPDPGFKQRDMNEAYNKGLQDGKKQAQSQQKPQQPQQQSQQQQQRPPVPAPYCAGINAERTEITAGQSVLIRFSMPFAYSYELRGGPGTVQAGGAVVKPTETTTYFVIGTGAPGAGQISMQQGFGFDQYSYQQQMMQQQQQAGGQQCQAQLGQACCGPVTITVNPAAKATSPEVIEDEPDNSFKEETPEMTCAPEALTRGRSVTVLWKCPEGSVRSVGRAAHRDGSILTSEESFTTDRKTTGKSKKLYPDKSTEYTVYCINDRGQKSQVASCRASIVTAAAKQLAQPATKKTTTPTKTTAASSESANALRMSITASPMTIQSGSGQEVHIEWKSLNAKTCKVEGPSGYIKENTTNDSVDGSADSAGDLEFVFTCTPKDGGPPQQKKVNVVAT